MGYFELAADIGRAHNYILLTQKEVGVLQEKVDELRSQVNELTWERDVLFERVNQLEHPERWD